MNKFSTHIQAPRRGIKIVRLQETFVTKSGKELLMRQVTLKNGERMSVPQYVVREEFPIVAGYQPIKGWRVTIDTVAFFVPDREQTADQSRVKAIGILFEHYGKDISVLKAVRTALHKENPRKNVLTGTKGVHVKSAAIKGKLYYMMTVSSPLGCNGYKPTFGFDPHNQRSLEYAYNQAMTLRTMIKANRLITKTQIFELTLSIRNGQIPLLQHKLPDDMFNQVRDNYDMRAEVKFGKGVVNPYNGQLIQG